MSWGVSVQEISVQESLCPEGVSVCSVWGGGVSVQRGLYPNGGLCPGSLPRGFSVWRSLSMGGSLSWEVFVR